MGESISRRQVLQVAQLAKLSLNEAEVDRMSHELGSILGYVSLLNEVDTRSVEPTMQVGVELLPLRCDEPQAGVCRELVLAQSPKTAHEGFAVPAFIDE